MSAASLAQLAESYSRIIDSTLKHVRETGLLREAGREVLDELECRWRAAAGKEVAQMEARQAQRAGGQAGGSRPSNAAALLTGGPSALVVGQRFMAPTSMPEALRTRPAGDFAHMTGVSFADPFSLPALAGIPSPPPLKCAEGFGGQREDYHSGLKVSDRGAEGGGGAPGAGGGTAPAAGAAGEAEEAGASRKKARKGQPANVKAVAPPLDGARASRYPGPVPGPTAAAAAPAGAPPDAAPLPGAVVAGPSAGESGSEDDEYDGVFDEAEVIVSAAAAASASQPAAGSGQLSEEGGTVVAADGAEPPSPPPVQTAPSSSDGSELGSDLDDSEFDEPDTENVLYAEVTKVVKDKRKWSMHMQRGVLMVDGVECLFSSGKGYFEFEEQEGVAENEHEVGAYAEALEDDAPPDAVLADTS